MKIIDVMRDAHCFEFDAHKFRPEEVFEFLVFIYKPDVSELNRMDDGKNWNCIDTESKYQEMTQVSELPNDLEEAVLVRELPFAVEYQLYACKGTKLYVRELPDDMDTTRARNLAHLI